MKPCAKQIEEQHNVKFREDLKGLVQEIIFKRKGILGDYLGSSSKSYGVIHGVVLLRKLRQRVKLSWILLQLLILP